MSTDAKVLYEFGRFRCDPREHLLLCEGKPVSLSPKSFEILIALIQSNGRLLTKDELMQQVWPDSFVEEANLTVNISALRKVLGETAEGQQYIETVPKRGYRFVAAVTEHRDDGNPAPAVETYRVAIGLDVGSTSRPHAKVRRWWLVLAGCLLFITVVTFVIVLRRPVKLSDKDTIVLADFDNSTGDPVFDGALRQGLSSQLEQSPFLNLLSDDRIAQTTTLMAQPKDSRLTPELAREVCQRTASAAVLDGTIAQVGAEYLLTLKAINCSNGESLGSAEAQALNKDHVLDALGKVASQIRQQLGESLASVEKYDAPPENVTTPSLEALQAYSLGYKDMLITSDYAGAVQLFQRAIKLDPNFAMAYARMGTSYSNLNETVRAAQALRTAYELRKRVSEREDLYITSHYELLVTGNLLASRRVCELWTQTYPRDAPFSNLGLIYSELGDYEKALAAFQNALNVNRGIGNWYATLERGYLQLNRFDEARATAQEALSKKIDTPEIHLNLYWVDFLQHDTAGMEREAALLVGKTGHEDQLINYEADTAIYEGRLALSRERTQRAIQTAQKADEKEAQALYYAQAAVREALVGNRSQAGQNAQDALALANAKDIEGLSAIAFALADEPARVKPLADDLQRRFPEDTIVQANYLPTINAAVFLSRGDGGKAVEALMPAAPYELGGNLETMNFVLYPVYLRGEAYLQMKNGPAAAAEFQKVLDHRGALRSEVIGALAHLEMARALALSADKIKAKNAYQQFLTLWKDADPDVPALIQARAESLQLN